VTILQEENPAMKYKRSLTAFGVLGAFLFSCYHGLEVLHTADFLPHLSHSRSVLFLFDLFGNPIGVAALCMVVVILATLAVRLYSRSRAANAAGSEPPILLSQREWPPGAAQLTLFDVGTDEREDSERKTVCLWEVRLGKVARFKRQQETRRVNRKVKTQP
jgi:hypothetical protein